MWIKLFLIICLEIILPVIYYSMRGHELRGNVCYGITIPSDCLNDQRILEIHHQYQKSLKRNMVLLLLFPFVMLVIPFFTIAFAVWLFWIFGMLIVMAIPIARANKAVAMRKEQENWSEKLAPGADDEDKYWKWGIFYHNPMDKRGSVETRIGIGTTLNLSHKPAKVLMVITILIVVSIPLLCIGMMREEFTPIYLRYEDHRIVSGQLRDNYVIDINNIEDIHLLDELPRMSKSNGTGLDNLCKGTFYIRNEGKCKVIYNPKNSKFIKIQTKDQTYYMSAATDEETVRIYNQIAEQESETE